MLKTSVAQDEVDALDAFMAGIQEEVAANTVSVKPREELALDQEDAVADFLEVGPLMGLARRRDTPVMDSA